MYGLASGALEMATERIGNVAKPLQKLYGKGAADDLADRVARKMAEKAATQKGKDLAYHGGKTAAAFMSEALEEMVAEGLDPMIANNIYANETGTQHSTSLEEILRAGAVGGVLGGVLGAGGQVVEYSRGAQVQDIYGEDGVKQLAKIAKESDDDADALTAEALDQMINEGGGIAAGQALQLKRTVEKQNAKDRGTLQDINRATDEIMRKEGLSNFIKKIDEDGNLDLTDSAREVYEGAKQKATEIADMIAPKDRQNQLKDMMVDKITSEVASIVTGAVMDIDTVNTFTTGNTLARQIYEQTTGETLPATNRETREYLYNQIAKNRQTSLEAETALQMDRFKGNVIQKVASTYAKNGQTLFADVMEGVDVRNMRQLNDSIVAFEDYYEAGRKGITLQELADLKNPAYDMLAPEIKTAAWNAGVQDKNAALGAVEERVLQLGQKLGENPSRANSVAPRGKVIHEFQDAENAMRFTASQQRFYQKMAAAFNINIHITDNPDYNGNYVNGEVWMSVDADRDLSYVFAHEITHHMQQFAPQEYADLKELIRTAWSTEELNAAINAKIAHYAAHNVKLSREDALDEIVADATYEMVQDSAFVTEMCNEDRTLARRILDALKNMIKKIRAMLAGNDFTPAQNAGLLSQLDILKEAERLWEIGLKKAEENRDAVGMVANSAITYDSLVAKADMNITKVTTDVDDLIGLSRKDIVNKARNTLSKKVAPDEKGRLNVFNKDTGNNIVIGKPGINHGLDRNYEHTAIVAMHLDEYLQNAIKINDLIADDGRDFDSDILLGYGVNNKGEKIPAYFVVAHLTTGTDELINFESLYSIRAKKIVEDSAQSSRGVQSSTSTTISISDLLEIVNEIYSDILPASVAEHFGNERKESKLGESVRWSLKEQQFDIIQNTNPMLDDYHTGIRSVDDILTFEEALNDSDWEGWQEDEFDPDYTGDMAQEALKTGRITVYSSYPIENGVFVTPSRMEAESYSATGEVHEQEVALEDVAWIDPTQGQYAKRENSNPDIRFSFAGESALNADNKMLKKAKEMYDEFEDSETIRKATGWHLGTDGKWRFEIDDSQMEVFPNGDAVYGKLNPGYVRLQELYDKFWESELTEEEQNEFERLENLYGFEFGRLRERLDSGNAKLKDILNHDVLYANYPQLAEVQVQAERMLGGHYGAYVVGGNKIVINSELLRDKYRTTKRDETLIHEIQHAIQDIEGFAKGANVEMLDVAIADAEHEYESARNLYNLATDNLENLLYKSGYFDKYGDDVDITSSEEQDRIKHEDIADIEEVVDDFARYMDKYWESAEKLRDLRNMSAYDFYRYSAGEVEARDAGSRVTFNEAGRKGVRPDIDSPRIVTENYIRYSLKDSEGSELTKKQAEYFKNSKIRDEDGNYQFKDGDINYDIEDQGPKWYNHHGWVTANNLLSNEEMAVFEEQVGAIKRGDYYRTSSGLYLVPTGEDGIHNVILYTDADFEEPSIRRIIRIDKNNNTAIDKIRKDIYYAEQYKSLQIIESYWRERVIDDVTVRDYEYSEWKRAREAAAGRRNDEDRAEQQDGRRSNAEDKRISFKDSEYLKAVKADDMETAQRLVDEAAEEWADGTQISVMDPETGEALFKFYRSRDGGRTVWDGHGNNETNGVFLTSDESIANAFDIGAGGSRYREYGHIAVYAKAENPLVLDAKGENYSGIPIEKEHPGWLRDAASYAVEFDDDVNDYVEVEYIDIDNLYPLAFEKGYDAVIVNNVLEGVGGGPATDVVLKNGGTQMKLADPVTYDDEGNVIPLTERFNEKNPDIRWSHKDDINVSVDDVNDYVNSHPEEFPDPLPYWETEQAAHRTRQQTMKELQSQLEKMKADRKLTHGKVLDPKSIEEEVNSLIRMLMSYSEGTTKRTDHGLVKLIQANAKNIFTDLQNGNQEDAILTAYYTAEEVVQNLKLVNDEMFNEYKELREYLRTTRVHISEEDRSNIPDFNDFRKTQMGRIRIVNEGGMSVDNMYQELLEMYPGMFDPELTHPADQLMEIADVRDTLDPYDIMLSHEETEQLIKETANDILELTVNGKPWKSWADRNKEVYDEKIKALKQKHKEALRDVKLKEKERWADKLQQTKEKGEQKLQEEKQKNKERQQKQRDAKNSREYIAKMEKQISWLSERLLKPTDDKHLPYGYEKAIAQLLYALDTQSERSKKLEKKYGLSKKRLKFLELKARYDDIAQQEETDIIIDADISEWLGELAERLEDKTIAEASNEETIWIYNILRNITGGIRNINNTVSGNKKVKISERAFDIIDDASARRKHKDKTGGLRGHLDSMLKESMITPRDFYEYLGSGMYEGFKEIRRGFDKHVDNITQTREFFDGIFKKYYNKKKPGSKLDKWRDTSTNQKFELEQGGEITLNIAQRMSLYCLWKREQARGHILSDGITATSVELNSKLKRVWGVKDKTKKVSSRVTNADVEKILDSLTPEQKQMADELQNFLSNECAAWGNEASMAMYNYEKFGEPNYFPIHVDETYMQSDPDKHNVAESIRNFGFTKAVKQGAKNAILVDDIFSVVADHVNKMSLYNAFAAPIMDFMRVYNYKTKTEEGDTISVKESLNETFGKRVHNYTMRFISDLQNNTEMRAEGFTRALNKLMANYKKSVIAGNVRVALQQPTALVRAWMLISPKYFTKVNVKKNTERMLEHCQVARWKAWGHSQVDMARDIDDIMMNHEWTKLDFWTMRPYGALDKYTWSYIWGAVEKEVQSKYPSVKVDSDEYFQLCNDRASEIFDKTQVVDSPMHKSQVMRGKDSMLKMITSFRSEPTRTYNMVVGQFALAKDVWYDGEKGKALHICAKTSYIFLLNAMVCAMAAALADALRGKELDDDDDEEGKLEAIWNDFADILEKLPVIPDDWGEHTWNNFKGNANPVNMIPGFSEITSYWGGWGTQNLAFEGVESVITTAKAILDKAEGGQEDKTWGELIKKGAEAVGFLSGIPVKNILRELETFSKMIGWEASAATKGAEIESVNIPELFDKVDWGNINIARIKDGSPFDNLLNHFGINLTDAEKAERERQELIKGYEAKLEGLTGKDRQEKLWSMVTRGYTTDLKNGDLQSIQERRKILEAMGGDLEYFDKRVKEETITAYKKSIGVDNNTSAVLKEFLIDKYGFTEGKISAEIIAKSDVAKQFQLALCAVDEEAAVDTLAVLLDEGITEADAYVLYLNMYDAIKPSDMTTGEFTAPVDGRITSDFGPRTAPTAGASSYHEGMDIAAPAGTVVGAADGGKVSSCGYNKTEGYYVRIYHGNERYTEYKHLEGFCVSKGQAVAPGQEIGRVGSTGVSTGPHLHFSVKESGVYVDPAMYLN